MIRSVTVVFAAIIFVLAEGGAPEMPKDESLTTLQQIDCVVKKLNWMINVTEGALLRFRTHVEEVYGKRYSLEERYTIWKGLFVHVRNLIQNDRSNEMKEILNEMGSVFETESYLQKKFDLNVSYLERKMIAVVRTGTRYAATMEEMYRVGLAAVRLVNKSHHRCENDGGNCSCEKSHFLRNLPDIISEFENSTEYIDLSYHAEDAQSNGGTKLSDIVRNVSTTSAHIIKHKGIATNLKGHVKTTDYGFVEKVNAAKLLKLFVTHLREIDVLTPEVEAMPSKLSERASRIETLEKKLRFLLNSITASTT